MTPIADKSTTEEIRERFDGDVDRFSSLETGQAATIDAPLVLELVAQSAATHLAPGDAVLDLGCGAGNFTLCVMREVGPLHCHLADLSLPMLTRARARVEDAGACEARVHQSDLRRLAFAEGSFDCILAGAVLHHLREEEDWWSVFQKLHRWLKPDGRLYVADIVTFDSPGIQALMWRRFSDYLVSLGGESYRDKVFAYIDKEDSPRSLAFQFELLRKVGFAGWDALHRNSVFACYFAQK